MKMMNMIWARPPVVNEGLVGNPQTQKYNYSDGHWNPGRGPHPKHEKHDEPCNSFNDALERQTSATDATTVVEKLGG